MTMNSGNIPNLLVDASALLAQAQSSNQTGVTTATEFLKTTTNNAQPSQPSETRTQQPPQQQSPSSDAQQKLQNFWNKQMEEIQNISSSEFKTQELPLARIKKIMKMDEDVKMISAEAPLLFSKAAQIFITELSLRAWIHTEDSKRRTLQRNDIANAITKFDQFDFLIDIVPREDLKPTKSIGGSEGVQYFYTLPQQARSAATSNNAAAQTNQGPVQMSSLQTGQILLAQQNQNGQPMTLTPVDSNQLMQLAQPSAQQSQQQVPSTIVLNTSPEGGTQVLQKQVTVSNPNNDPKQQQNAQAILQQLVSNLPQTGGNEVHSIQINSQGQLHLVKVANAQSQSQTTVTAESVGHDSQRLMSESDTNEMYELAAGIASSARSADGATASDATQEIDEMYAKIAENT